MCQKSFSSAAEPPCEWSSICQWENENREFRKPDLFSGLPLFPAPVCSQSGFASPKDRRFLVLAFWTNTVMAETRLWAPAWKVLLFHFRKTFFEPVSGKIWQNTRDIDTLTQAKCCFSKLSFPGKAFLLSKAQLFLRSKPIMFLACGKQINQKNFVYFCCQYIRDECQEKTDNSDMNTDVSRLWGFYRACSTEDVNLPQSSYWALAQPETARTFSAANACKNCRISVVVELSLKCISQSSVFILSLSKMVNCVALGNFERCKQSKLTKS